jgi:ketosteroid isomerase-like protein
MRTPLLVIVAALGAACSRATSSAPRVGDDVRAEVIAVETAWNDAIVRKDTAAVARILAPDFVYVTPDGQVVERALLLRAIADPLGRMEPFTTRDVVVRRHGDAVVVTGWFRQAGTADGQPYASFVRYTDVYVRKDGRWIAVSAHASRLPREPG